MFVGPCGNAEVFSVEKALLVPSSAFFKRVSQGGWKESNFGWIRMPEDKAVVFQRYLNIVYTGLVAVSREPGACLYHKRILACMTDSTYIVTESDDYIPVLDADGFGWQPSQRLIDSIHAEYDDMAEVYVLCEKLEDTKARKAVMTAMIQAVHKVRSNGLVWLPPSSAITILFRGTVVNHPMRRYLADLYANHAGKDSLGDSAEAYPAEFLKMVAQSILARRSPPKDTSDTEALDSYPLEVL